MNQTVTVNISGIVFHIEIDAYDTLKNYLNKIRSYFKNSDECNEIMADIEARVAEIFNIKLTQTNQVIKSQDVEEVVEVMGKPEQYVDDEAEETTSSKNSFTTAKKLFRDPDDRAIGGVASGVAAYFGLEALWIRLFFIVSLFFGFGFILYAVLWIIIPEAKTASDKLFMKGDPVNIDNIGKTFKEEADRVSDNIKKNGQHFGKKTESAIEAFFGFLTQLFNSIFNVLGKVFGMFFLIVGTFSLLGLIGMLVGSDTIFSITTEGIFSIESKKFFNLVFVSEDQFYFAIIGIILAVGLPMLLLIYAGVKLLFKVKTPTGIGIGIFVFWMIGLFACGMVGIRMGTELSFDESISSKEIIHEKTDHFVISANTSPSPGNGILEDKYSIISLDEDSVYFDDISFSIHKSKSDSIEFKVIKSSNGKSIKSATNNARMISYHYEVKKDSILLNNYIATLKENKIRGQPVIILSDH